MAKEAICGIYKITSPSGKIYIGQSRDINKRKKSYIRCDCGRQRKLYNSLKKYGWDSHTFEIVHTCDVGISQIDLDALEVYYEELNNATDSKTGLNLRKCGKTRGLHSEESKQLMKDNHWVKKEKAAGIKKKIGDGKKGKPTWSKGIPFTEEHRKNIGKANKGKKFRPRTEEEKEHLRIITTGKKRRQETKDRISASNTIAYADPERREKCRLQNLGRKRSAEASKKQRTTRMGKQFGESKYLGVGVNRSVKGGKEYVYWIVGIRVKGERTKVKRFPFTKQGERDAALYYNEMSIKLLGDLAVLNIISNNDEV